MAPIFENTDLLAHTCGLLDAADISLAYARAAASSRNTSAT